MSEHSESPLGELFQDGPKMSMTDQAYEQIRETIESGKLEPGYVFPNETVMCQQMHIGRSTLREAYKQLALAGYITRSKRGTSVNDRETILGAKSLKTVVEESDEVEFREFRLMLECQTAELAAAHATDEDLAELAEIQSQLQDARDERDIDAMSRLDKAFHTGIAAATHNQLFVVSMCAVSAVWDEQVLNNFRRMAAEGRRVLNIMIGDHRAILRALQEHDSEAAREAMRKHITHVSPSQGARHFRQ